MTAKGIATAELIHPGAHAHGRRGHLLEHLADARSGRVVFLSHCLLNENVRFLGGAARPGAVAEVVEPYIRDGVTVAGVFTAAACRGLARGAAANVADYAMATAERTPKVG